MFISIIEKVRENPANLMGEIKDALRQVSAPDEIFEVQLRGPIYDDNYPITRFVLISLARGQQTKEFAHWNESLWEKSSVGESKDVFVWTVEHILPQGERLPLDWVTMLGGPEVASEVQRSNVHTIGNLTITAFNQTLGNKSFEEKRDRVDKSGNFVGYKNNLLINADLSKRSDWGEMAILERTERLVQELLVLFNLS